VLKPIQSPQSRHESSKRDGLLKCLPQDMVRWGQGIVPLALQELPQHGVERPIVFTIEPLFSSTNQLVVPHLQEVSGVFTDLPTHRDRSSTRSMHPNGSPLDHRLWWRLRSRCRSSDYATRLRVFTLLRCHRDVRSAAVQEEPTWDTAELSTWVHRDASSSQTSSFSLSKRGRGLDCAVPRGLVTWRTGKK
jgi:hypothetical protein